MTQNTNLNRRRFGAGLMALSAVSACTGGNEATPRSNRQTENRVALLLPLSGPRAPLGEQMAKTVWLVEDMSGQRGRTDVIDAGETPGAAAAAAQKAIARGANIIVGPLFRDQTPAVVQAAKEIPVITLSNDADLATQGAWVFGVTPTQSVEAVLRYAKQSGAKRVTLLETSDALSARANTALRQGARKARVTSLPPVAAATQPGGMEAALKNVGSGQMPDILYVPTSNARTLDQAVAAVQTGVTTIGSLQWAGLPPQTLERLDKACFIGPDPGRFGRLSASYRAQLDEEMGVIAALAVDAVAVAQDIGGKRRLTQRKPYNGLLGPTRFLSDRTCERTLAVLRISGTGVLRVA
ncbi:ABC transporter substrate-binding protein [Sulfitobacter sp. JB4-11]|uniref:ABC transporter substrate-binding protein n=1 Tax=Sulfitobacter rhodophyticola TaxID=3238304 RepID=UPI0035189629